MSKSKIDYDALDKAYNSAPMQEAKSASDKKMKKLISMPTEWEEKIKRHFKDTVNGYITMAIYERIQKDWII